MFGLFCLLHLEEIQERLKILFKNIFFVEQEIGLIPSKLEILEHKHYVASLSYHLHLGDA